MRIIDDKLTVFWGSVYSDISDPPAYIILVSEHNYDKVR